MSKKDYYDPIIDQYRIPGAQIHVTNNGKNIAVKDGKVVGEDASFVLPQATKVGYSPRTQKMLSILGIKNEKDLKGHTNKDGSINWNSFIITPWQAAQMQSLKDPNWRDKYGMSSDMETMNAVTAGVLNRLSPSQNIRAIYDIFDPSISTQNKIRSTIIGNNGIVPDKFANEHPFTSAIINGAFDAFTMNPKNLVGLYKGAKDFAHKSYLINKYDPVLSSGIPFRTISPEMANRLADKIMEGARGDDIIQILLKSKEGRNTIASYPGLKETLLERYPNYREQILKINLPKLQGTSAPADAIQEQSVVPKGYKFPPRTPKEEFEANFKPEEIKPQFNNSSTFKFNLDEQPVSNTQKIKGQEVPKNYQENTLKVNLGASKEDIANIKSKEKLVNNIEPEELNGNLGTGQDHTPKLRYRLPNGDPVEVSIVNKDGNTYGIDLFGNKIRLNPEGTEIAAGPQLGIKDGSRYNLQPESWKVTSSGNGNYSIESINKKPSKFYQYAYTRPIKYENVVTKGLLQKGKEKLMGTKTSQDNVHTSLQNTYVSYDPRQNIMSIKETGIKAAPMRYFSKARVLGTVAGLGLAGGKHIYNYALKPIYEGLRNYYDYSGTYSPDESKGYDWNGRITLDNGVDVDTIMRNGTIYGILNEPSTIKDSEYVPSKGGNWYPASRVFKDSEGNYRVDPNSLIHVNKGPFGFNLPNEINNQELQKPQEHNIISPEQQAIDNQYNADEPKSQETQEKPKTHNTKHKKKTNSNSLPKMTDPDYEEYERGEILSYIPKQFRNTYYG